MMRVPFSAEGIGFPAMPCGHPLAARRIVVVEGDIITTCWACSVQREIVSKIVGPAKRAGLARDGRVE